MCVWGGEWGALRPSVGRQSGLGALGRGCRHDTGPASSWPLSTLRAPWAGLGESGQWPLEFSSLRVSLTGTKVRRRKPGRCWKELNTKQNVSCTLECSVRALYAMPSRQPWPLGVMGTALFQATLMQTHSLHSVTSSGTDSENGKGIFELVQAE